MTSYTGIWCIIIIAVVAIRTTRACMGAIQGPIIIVNREAGRHPVRVGGMAHITIGRDIQSWVVRIRAAVEIRLVTTHTSVRCVVVITSKMAGGAIVGNGEVCPGQWIKIIVVKSRRYPCSLRVAILTRRRKLI